MARTNKKITTKNGLQSSNDMRICFIGHKIMPIRPHFIDIVKNSLYVGGKNSLSWANETVSSFFGHCGSSHNSTWLAEFIPHEQTYKIVQP